ncbi:unnamed protein product [Cuscuta campestris]|uniref:Uncharacterized protein n=1 Tax=Cuscuta campestris TaxID=132261 RepID=A0A484MQV8_9ASTE|nr:unnamed protein product [Cuscuta campestris]
MGMGCKDGLRWRLHPSSSSIFCALTTVQQQTKAYSPAIVSTQIAHESHESAIGKKWHHTWSINLTTPNPSQSLVRRLSVTYR